MISRSPEARRLWIVTNRWLGNGNEGVIVEAPDEAAALMAAKDVLKAEWTADLAKAVGDSEKAHAREHLDSYDDPDLSWWTTEVFLPHVGEF